MAGCAKADRNRKSAQNAVYKATNRQEINKKRRQARAAKQAEKKAKKWALVPLKNPRRGSARFLRRKDLQLAYGATS